MGSHIILWGRSYFCPLFGFHRVFLCESKENFPLGKTIKTLGKGFAFFLLVVFVRPVDFWRDILVTPWLKIANWVVWASAFPLVLLLRDIPCFRVQAPINTKKAYGLFFLVNVLTSFLAVSYRFGLLRSVL